MKKPLRLFAFVFFLFAVYLNLFYKEDSFLSRIAAGKNSIDNSQTSNSVQPEVANATDMKLAEVQVK
jgi:hypothetical protein